MFYIIPVFPFGSILLAFKRFEWLCRVLLAITKFVVGFFLFRYVVVRPSSTSLWLVSFLFCSLQLFVGVFFCFVLFVFFKHSWMLLVLALGFTGLDRTGSDSICFGWSSGISDSVWFSIWFRRKSQLVFVFTPFLLPGSCADLRFKQKGSGPIKSLPLWKGRGWKKKEKKNEARKRSNCVGKENDAEREMKSSPTRHFVFWSTTQLKEEEEEQQQLVEETEKEKRQTKKSEEQKRRKRKEEMQLRPGNRTCKGSRTNVARHTQSRVITPVRREKKKRGKQNKINENDRNSHMKTSEGTWQHLLFARCPPREQSNQVFDDYFPSRRKPSKSTQKPVEPRVI